MMKLIRALLYGKWEPGTLHDRPARRNRLTGECQFVLWKAGEHHHVTDYWHKFDSSWWPEFIPSK
jgi:hypothetical protein